MVGVIHLLVGIFYNNDIIFLLLSYVGIDEFSINGLTATVYFGVGMNDSQNFERVNYWILKIILVF